MQRPEPAQPDPRKNPINTYTLPVPSREDFELIEAVVLNLLPSNIVNRDDLERKLRPMFYLAALFNVKTIQFMLDLSSGTMCLENFELKNPKELPKGATLQDVVDFFILLLEQEKIIELVEQGSILLDDLVSCINHECRQISLLYIVENTYLYSYYKQGILKPGVYLNFSPKELDKICNENMFPLISKKKLEPSFVLKLQPNGLARLQNSDIRAGLLNDKFTQMDFTIYSQDHLLNIVRGQDTIEQLRTRFGDIRLAEAKDGNVAGNQVPKV